MDLFGEVIAADTSRGDVYSEFYRTRSWTIKERLNNEKETLGLYLTGHPIDEYESELSHLVSSRISNLKPEKSTQTIAGLIINQRIVKTKRGDNMAIVTLDDRTARMDITLFSEAYTNARDILLKDGLLVITGQVSFDDYSGMLKMSAENVRLLADVRQEKARELSLVLESGHLPSNAVQQLSETLDPYRSSPQQDARCSVVIHYQRSDARAQLRLGDAWRVRPEDDLLARLRDQYGAKNVSLHY